MKNNIKIAKYSKSDDKFILDGYDEYVVTYLKDKKIHSLRVVVNGYITKEKIDLLNYKTGYKKSILKSIKEFKEFGNETNCVVKNTLKLSYMETFYSRQIIGNVKKYLLPINKEESRDTLTEYGLI